MRGVGRLEVLTSRPLLSWLEALCNGHCTMAGHSLFSLFLLCLLGLLVSGATATALPKAEPLPWSQPTADEQNCRMGSSPRGWLRILLPLNGTTVEAGSMMIFIFDDIFRGSTEGGRFVLSIDGAEWLSVPVPSRPRANQLPLPRSLLPGPHRIHVDLLAADVPGESACVW